MIWLGTFLGIAILVGLLAFHWRRRPEDLLLDHIQALLPFAEHSRWITVAGVRLHYLDKGQGPPLVLVHGYGASAYSWREVFEPLSKSYRVIALDLKGFGLSEKPKGDYRLEMHAELIVQFMQALNLEPAVLIGNSMGGALSLAVTIQHPELVRALVLVDSAAFTLGRAPRFLRSVLRPPVGEYVGPYLSPYLVNRSLNLCYYDPSRITSNQRAIYRAPLSTRRGAAAAYHTGLAFDSAKILERLDQIPHPKLIIWGDTDRIIPIENAYRFRDRLSNSRLVVLERCGHIPQEECPERFLEVTLPFLQEVTHAAPLSSSTPSPSS